MNIGILGYGWLGSAIGEHFLAQSDQIFATLRSSTGKEVLDSSIVCSLLDLDEVHPDLPHFFPELDILIIAVPFSKSQQLQHVKENLRRIINALSDGCGIIMCSTIGVYQKDQAERITEKTSIYKNKADAQVEDLIQKLRPDVVILRLAGLIGKDRNPVVRLSQKQFVDGGASKVNLVHQKDVVKLVDVLVKEKIKGQIFNVCSPEHPIKETYYTAMAGVFEVSPPQFSSENSHTNIVDSSQVAQLLNFSFESSIFNR